MTTKEKLTGLFKIILNMEETEVAALFNAEGELTDDAVQALLDADKARIKGINDDHAAEVTNADLLGFNRAKKEVMSSFEEKLRTAHGVKSKKQGLDLVNDIITEKSKGLPGQITETDILNSQQYKDLQDKLAETESRLTREKEEAVANVEREVQKKETLKFISQTAKGEIIALNPVLPMSEDDKLDQAKADKQINFVIGELLSENDFSVDETNGKPRITLLGKDGKPKVDGHGKRIEFSAAVKAKAAETFSFRKADPKKTPPNPAGGGGSGGGSAEKVYAKLNLEPAKSRDELSKGLTAITESKLSEEEKATARVQFNDDSKATIK